MSTVGEPLGSKGESQRRRALNALRAVARPLDEGRFWEVIEGLGWGRRTSEAHDAARQLARAVGPVECLGAQARFVRLEGELERSFTAWAIRSQDDIGLGDELERNLRQHVIGLGRATYAAAFTNPALAKQRGERDDYLDSFGHVFKMAFEEYADEAIEEALRQLPAPPALAP